VISHSVSECQSDESGEFAIFPQNRLPWQRPLWYRKRGPDRSSAPKTLSFSEKTAKIGPAYPEIIVLREIIKKRKKKEITEDKIYSQIGNLAELGAYALFASPVYTVSNKCPTQEPIITLTVVDCAVRRYTVTAKPLTSPSCTCVASPWFQQQLFVSLTSLSLSLSRQSDVNGLISVRSS